MGCKDFHLNNCWTFDILGRSDQSNFQYGKKEITMPRYKHQSRAVLTLGHRSRAAMNMFRTSFFDAKAPCVCLISKKTCFRKRSRCLDIRIFIFFIQS